VKKESLQTLESLAEQDPVIRPLALLQLESLRASTEPAWEAIFDDSSEERTEPPRPALHHRVVTINRALAADLHSRLVDVLHDVEVPVEQAAIARLREPDPLEMIEAAIEWDGEALERLAGDSGVELPVLVTLAHCLALPATLAAGRKTLSDADKGVWEPGYCPVCGNWPLIAEDRGLDRQRWLRCGRCSAGWRSRHLRCVYCDNTDHTSLGYLAPEAERESRRAVTCEQCKGYLKVFATVAPLEIADLLRYDLESLELDVAAMGGGYSRPERPGFRIAVDVVARESGARSWFSWR
jgi:FdhE protein